MTTRRMTLMIRTLENVNSSEMIIFTVKTHKPAQTYDWSIIQHFEIAQEIVLSIHALSNVVLK